MLQKTCNNCRFSVLEDNGYSNWTVEGTDVSCLLNLNDKLPCDNFYGADPILKFAETCPSFQAGNQIHIDVEHEVFYERKGYGGAALTDDKEIADLFDKEYGAEYGKRW